ncbi:hypothetical protein [Oceanidesulfovibrio marinus]|uniref:WXG100 family type VII secretion target n=1 Tax=Oceanidesulfovibrio marinus TaxID=370038 RepID=A0ABX6NHV4_9BACT|nr:hypothetical protein [Oceanidesulfovibrio marinus]QJT10217.1 hypothetical protein E8L03_15325 [Oceanidesulfovibrio marinus]
MITPSPSGWSAQRLRQRQEQLASVSVRFTALHWAMSAYFEEHSDAVLDGLAAFMGELDRDLHRLSEAVAAEASAAGCDPQQGGGHV